MSGTRRLTVLHYSLKRKLQCPALTGKTALITGASRGIGAAIAKRLATEGARVAITYTHSADTAAYVVKGIEAAGGHAIAIKADATKPAEVTAAVEQVVATFGSLDVLVNNAGTAIPKPFEEATAEELDRVIDINLRGVLVTTQVALKHIPDGGPHHQHWLLCRRAADDPGPSWPTPPRRPR